MTHTHTRRAALAAALLVAAGAAAGCNDFLTGEGLTESPNTPTAATPLQLFAGVQAAQTLQQESQLARLAAMYTQQLSGTSNQQLTYGSRYGITEADVGPRFTLVYVGGGLVDLRRIQEAEKAAGDQRFEGIAKVWEALTIGTAASLWGDIPYREAVNPAIATPKLDPQRQVYADVQAKLDTAITLLDGAGPGPLQYDRVYNGDAGRWKRAAHTLKARFHMHLVEREGTSALLAARAAALNGINEPPTTVDAAIHQQGPGDLRTFHGVVPLEGNLWAQFLGSRQDMTSNQTLISILQRRGDPRLAAFFTPGTGGVYRGADQFGRNAAGASAVNGAVRLQLPFRQPLVTWAENQLILAEVAARLGDADPAPYVNAVRRAIGMSDLASPVTLDQVVEEKYVAMFQNIEVWNDYKRSCYPLLTPGGANNTPAAEVPGRIPYGFAERNANPNIPLPNEQPARNWNDPSPCPKP